MADVGPGVAGEVQVPLQDGVEDLLLALAPEGGHPTQQDVEDHPARPDVCLGAVAPPQHLQRLAGPSVSEAETAKRCMESSSWGAP